ncbi:MAG: glycosyltransferase family 4 protein [Actinomycetota bacterium]
MNTKQQKSVLVLVASNRRRGAEVFGEHLSRGLGDIGWEVDFVALQSVTSDRVVSASTLTDRGSLGRIDLGTVRSLRSRIRDTGPSVILANGGATLRYAIAARVGLRPNPVLAYASIGEPRYWIRSTRHARLQTFLHRRADLVLAVSDMTRTQLVDDLHVDAERIHVAHTGVAPAYFVDGGDPHEELRMVYLGSISDEKDPIGALDVVSGLRGSHDVMLRMIGDGPLAAEVKDYAREMVLDDVVEFTGPVEDVTPHLRWADVLILTSRTEGLPGAALEAGAASVPVVAFDVGGTSETMIDGTTGILVRERDTDTMVASIDALARDRQRLASMGEAARTFVAQNYTLETAITRYDAILDEAVTEARQR